MNKIILSGTLVEKPSFSHEVREQKFYSFMLSSKRKSDISDVLPCIVSEALVDEIAKHEKIKIVGEVRTRNIYIGEKRKLDIYVFVREVMEHGGEDENSVKLNGIICKTPVYRVTPRKIEITDFMVSSNRGYGKPDYIPCIAWNENSRKVTSMWFGTEINLIGRLQSREYNKKLDNGAIEKRIAYELSVSRVDEVEVVNDASEN